MNSLPEQWIVMEIGQVGEVVAGGTPSTKKDEYWGTDICWITPLDLSGYKEKYISKGRKSLTKLGLEKSSARLIPKDSILFSSRAPIGYVAVAANELATNQGFKNLIPSPIIESDFLYYYFKSIKKMAYELASGTTFKELSAARFAKIPVPVPPKKEQQVIVEKIEELFSDLDNAVENLQNAREQLKVYRQSILKNAFEGKLTNKNLKNGELPATWKRVFVTDLVEKNKHAIKAGPFGSSLKKEFYVPKGYKIYGQEQVINGDPFYGDYYITEDKYKELYSNKIKPFDVLISLVGTVGKVLILPENCMKGIINPRLIKVTLDRNIYLPEFFKYYFESSNVKSFCSSKAQGTTMDVLNLSIIKTIPFPLCSVKEQQKIVAEIESRFSVCDQMEETIETSLKQAEALRQSILKQAFEGKLTERWRKEHPDLISGENSAAALLAKIKAEKEALKKITKTSSSKKRGV